MISWTGSTIDDFYDGIKERKHKGFAILERNEDGSFTQYKG